MYNNRTVILADDQSPPRAQLRELLRNTGCTVVGEANNTDDLLDRYERLESDAVIIDVTLPGTVDALVAIRLLRQRNPTITILATGTASQDTVIMEALSMGATDFFLKPFHDRSVHLCFQKSLL
jgi:DNA-binding NarL/FixJ family response regulator